MRQAILSDEISFEDKASSKKCRQEENSDGDSVRNNFAILSSRLPRSVRDINVTQGNRLLHSDGHTYYERWRMGENHVCSDDALQVRFPVFSFLRGQLGYQDCMHGTAKLQDAWVL
jgi:hypothetical protein